MFNIRALLQPDLVLKQPVLGLTPAILQQHNIQGLILDVDETLVPFSVAEVSVELADWAREVRGLVPLWLVSNNTSATRIGRIAKVLDLPYVSGAQKPSRRKLRQAAADMDLPVERIAMVGDRLFTDVLAGNRLGMFTILVDPMVDPAQEFSLRPIHAIEVWISRRLGVSL
ncbi:MAG: YqeG family HAD IIIA-type phosphatase [Cyanobacteria bacterium P01_A01_bin.135]